MQTDNVLEDMAVDASGRYDFREYPLNHPRYSVSNCKALGFFKDELNSVPMEEFVGLRPKCYAFMCTGQVEKKTAKGVKRKVKDDHLSFGHYTFITHSYGHRDTVENASFITECIAQTGIYGLHCPPTVESDHDSDGDDSD